MDRIAKRNLVQSLIRLLVDQITEGKSLPDNDAGDTQAWADALHHVEQAATAVDDVGRPDLDD